MKILRKDIDRISIDKNTFWLMPKSKSTIDELSSQTGQTIFKRGDWKLYVNDVKQIQDREKLHLNEPNIKEMQTLILFDKSVDCEIDEYKKIISCAKSITPHLIFHSP